MNTHTAASITPNSSKMSHLAISLKVEPSRIFCIIAARSLRALSLMREHVASACFCRGGTTFGDLYCEGETSDEIDATTASGDANAVGDEKNATGPEGDTNEAEPNGDAAASRDAGQAGWGLEK